jgi:hypothetical protein
MTPRYTSPLTGSQVFEADARTIAPHFTGTALLAILDGPYGLGKAAWDKIPRGGTLADLYQGALDDVGTVCLPSASLYLWNTSAGWAELHPHVLARGWTFRSLIVWHKPDGAAIKSAHEEGARTWPEVMEVCGFYQREEWAIGESAGAMIGTAAGKDVRNPTTEFIRMEREQTGMTRKQMAAHFPSASGGLTGCVTNWEEGYNFPTWEVYQRFAAACAQHGPPRERPYLVHPSCWPGGDLRASYDHLRAEYEASRPPFTCPLGVGNVWTVGQVAGPERLKDANGETMHPCQKPLLFAERMIRASSRPGSTCWAPYGGTLRELVAAERMARLDPADARRVITCELNQDNGRDYIGAALEQIGAEVRPKGGQVGLFGAPR